MNVRNLHFKRTKKSTLYSPNQKCKLLNATCELDKQSGIEACSQRHRCMVSIVCGLGTKLGLGPRPNTFSIKYTILIYTHGIRTGNEVWEWGLGMRSGNQIMMSGYRAVFIWEEKQHERQPSTKLLWSRAIVLQHNSLYTYITRLYALFSVKI